MRTLGVVSGLVYGLVRYILARFILVCFRHPVLAGLLFIDLALIYITL